MTDTPSLDWLLDDLVDRVPAARQAVVLSVDGLLTGSVRQSGRSTDAEHLAAVAAGFSGLARTAGRHFRGGPVRQTIVEMESAFLFITSAGQGACLAVLSESDSDIGLIAYEMAMLVERIGSTCPRRLAAAVVPRRCPVTFGPNRHGDRLRWLDGDAGPLVRSFALTGGRARSGADAFDLLTYVVATAAATEPWSATCTPNTGRSWSRAATAGLGRRARLARGPAARRRPRAARRSSSSTAIAITRTRCGRASSPTTTSSRR